MSFLDERDPPRRSADRRPSTPRGAAVDRQTLMVRRSVAGGAVVLLLVLLVLGVRGFLDARQERAFKDYARDVAELVQASNQQSASLFELLRSGRQSTVEAETTVNGFGVEAEQLAERAADTDAPDDLEESRRFLVETLEFRRDGMRQIARLLPTALGDEGASEATERIAGQMLTFLASDVIYSQRVVPSLQDPLREEDVLDEVQVEQSEFLPNIDWLIPSTVADKVSRIRGSGTDDGEAAPGLHGNGVTGVTVQPSGNAISAGGAAEIPAGENLAFDVQVQNQGEFEERDVTVSVEIAGAGEPLQFEERLDSIAAGETKTVRIPIAEAPPTGRPVEVKVTVEPVDGEENTDNNSLTTRAIFSG